MNVRTGVRRFLPYLIAIAGGFLLAYLIVAFVIFPSGVIPQALKVPNVIGLTYDDAAQQLDKVGLRAEQGETRFHATAPKGTVLEQSPPPGSKDAVGATVKLAVSGGQRTASVPAVVGMTREAATQALEAAGYGVGDVTERPESAPRGTVVASSPRGGAVAPTPGPVALVLSAGPTVVIVPDLIGRQVTEARLLLGQLGLRLGDVTNDPNSVADASAAVVQQSPPAGSQAAAGSRVSVRVGSRR